MFGEELERAYKLEKCFPTHFLLILEANCSSSQVFPLLCGFRERDTEKNFVFVFDSKLKILDQKSCGVREQPHQEC